MHLFSRVLATSLVLTCGLTGCSTPRKRAHQHASAFHRLSPVDQVLVLHGRVRPGLSQDGVYIAWGEPDQKTVNQGGKDGASTETWIYRQRVTITEPQNSYEYFGPHQGYGDLLPTPPPRSGGGSGNEALQWFQPHVRSLDTLRIAEFRTGKANQSKTAVSTWPTTRSGVRNTRRTSKAATSRENHLRRDILRGNDARQPVDNLNHRHLSSQSPRRFVSRLTL